MSDASEYCKFCKNQLVPIRCDKQNEVIVCFKYRCTFCDKSVDVFFNIIQNFKSYYYELDSINYKFLKK